jgi:hypothetical protein
MSHKAANNKFFEQPRDDGELGEGPLRTSEDSQTSLVNSSVKQVLLKSARTSAFIIDLLIG